MSALPRPPTPPRLAGSRVVVVGASKSGVAMARFLVSRQASVVLTDPKPPENLGAEVGTLGRAGPRLELGGHDATSLTSAHLVAGSPGVPLTTEPIAQARRSAGRWGPGAGLPSSF